MAKKRTTTGTVAYFVSAQGPDGFWSGEDVTLYESPEEATTELIENDYEGVYDGYDPLFVYEVRKIGVMDIPRPTPVFVPDKKK